MRRLCGLGQVLARTGAGIKQPAFVEFAPESQVTGTPFTLRVWCMGAANVRTFLPTDTEPPQVVEHGADVFRPGTLRVQILIAKDQGSTSRKSALESSPE